MEDGPLSRSTEDELLTLPSDILSKILTEHELTSRDHANLERTCKALRCELRRENLSPWRVVYNTSWSREVKRQFAVWFRQNLRHVAHLDFVIEKKSDWAVFTDLLAAYHEHRCFPRVRLSISKDQYMNSLRELAHAPRLLPPIQEIFSTNQDPDAPRKFLVAAHRLVGLEDLTLSTELVDYTLDRDPKHEFPLTHLPASLRLIYVDDDVGKVSAAIAAALPREACKLEHAMMFLTGATVQKLPSMPQLEGMCATGELEFEGAMELFRKAPNLRFLSHSVYRDPIKIRNMDMVKLPASLRELTLITSEALSEDNPIWSSNVDELTLYFDMDADEDPEVYLPAAMATSNVTSLSIRSTVTVVLPDISKSGIMNIHIKAPRTHIKDLSPKTFVIETYSDTLSFTPSSSEDGEEESGDDASSSEESGSDSETLDEMSND